MRTLILIVGLAVVVAVVASTAASNLYADKSGKGVLSTLKVGQPVALDEDGAVFDLQVSTRKLSTSYRVVEVGRDYVVLGNKRKLLEVRIPVSSIRSIVHLKR